MFYTPSCNSEKTFITFLTIFHPPPREIRFSYRMLKDVVFQPRLYCSGNISRHYRTIFLPNKIKNTSRPKNIRRFRFCRIVNLTGLPNFFRNCYPTLTYFIVLPMDKITRLPITSRLSNCLHQSPVVRFKCFFFSKLYEFFIILQLSCLSCDETVHLID